MYSLDIEHLKEDIEDSVIKQKTIAEKAGITEEELDQILKGERDCELGEYAGLCRALGYPPAQLINKVEKGASLIKSKRMKIPNGYYIINHYYPEVTRKIISKCIQLLIEKENPNDDDIEILQELTGLYKHFTESKLSKHSESQISLLESLKK